MVDEKKPIPEAEEEERFLLYLDGTMPPDQIAAFEAELARDSALSERFEAYQSATNLLHHLGEQEEEVNLLPNLERRIGMRPKTRPELVWRVPLEIGGMLAVMLAAVLLFMHGLKQEEVVMTVRQPGPVEIYLRAAAPQEVLSQYQITVTGASEGTANRVFAGRMSHAAVKEFIQALGSAMGRVRWYPNNPCDPCTVLLFDVPDAPPPSPK